MSFRTILFLMSAVFMLAGPAMAGENPANEAADLFTRGDVLLKQGDFDGAFQAYASAAKVDPENTAYAEKAKRVRRIQLLRKYVKSQEVSEKWEKIVLSLHAFYLQNGILAEALAMDRTAHEKLNSTLSASLLAETLLEMNKNGEAVAVLEGLAPEKANLQTRLYLGIALARVGRLDEARQVAQNLEFPDDAIFGLQYDYARLQAALGNREGAYNHLALCFEKTLPSQLAMVKGFARGCADFKPLLADAGFKKAMKTASKVSESECSSGSSCSTCPNRSGCSSDKESGSSDGNDEGSCETEKSGGGEEKK